jgi:hypothetical protein
MSNGSGFRKKHPLSNWLSKDSTPFKNMAQSRICSLDTDQIPIRFSKGVKAVRMLRRKNIVPVI